MNAVLLALTLVFAQAYVTSGAQIDCALVQCAGCSKDQNQVADYNQGRCCPKCVTVPDTGSVKVCPPPCGNFFATCANECATSDECRGNELCCYNGCGTKCIPSMTVQVPKRANGAKGCKYNGQTYNVGDVFNADAPFDGCRYCQCMGNGDVKCQPAPAN